jgi:peptide-methionine (S)-S-oxide reductase
MHQQTLVLAGGCFWCTEAVFEQLEGVLDVTSGYAGGKTEDADYDSVCTGMTNHAEAIRITFDADVISCSTLLDVFFHVAHDPTQKDRQGNDNGRQYRSAIFYINEAEQQLAQTIINELDASGIFSKPIVTTLEPLDTFYPAESYHQDYARAHPMQPYIFCVAKPKVDKLIQTHPELLKKRLK